MTSRPPALRRRATAAALATGAALVCAASASAAPVTVTLAFDDGMGTRNDPAEILAPTGTRATFYVNTANVDKATTTGEWYREYLSWDQLAELHDAGHEIAGHTLHHVRLTPPDPAPPADPPTDPPGGDPPVTDPAAGEPPTDPPPTAPGPQGPTEEEIRTEVCDDREALTGAGYAARSFAYPYGRSDARSRAIVEECGYISGRTTSAPSPAEAIPPVNPFATEAANTDGMNGAQMLALVDAAKRGGGGWLQLIFHDICDTDDALCNGTPQDTVTPRALKDLVAGLAADPEVRVRTAGDVVGADAEATPPAFATTAVGGTAEASAVVRNDGAAPLRLTATRLVGGNGRFDIVADACSGATVPAGGSCAVSVRFSPTAVGTTTARLELPGNTDPQTTVVPLTATGAAVVPPPADPPADPPTDPPGGAGNPGADAGGSGGTDGSGGSTAPPPGTPAGTVAPPVDPPASGPSAQVEAAKRAAVRRARARLVRARTRALRVCNRKASRRARAACRTRTRARYARRLRDVTVVRAPAARR
jgi:peptidoglycan/xylan/chitin deacetylase (PgdA/CDA1 family)